MTSKLMHELMAEFPRHLPHGSVNEGFKRPDKLTDDDLDIIAKRVGLTDTREARLQYIRLYHNRDRLTVQAELERLHAKFIAARLKRSAL